MRWIALLISLATTLSAQSSVGERFLAARSAYDEGRFAAAREEFQALLREGAGASVPLLEAIARCSGELGEHAHAIAACRSALLRAPGDAAIVAALRHAESELGMDPSPLTRRERGSAVWIAILGAGVQLLGVVSWMRRRRAMGGLAWAVGLGLSGLAVHDVVAGADGRAVVVVPEVALRPAPEVDPDGSSLRLRAGEIVVSGEVIGDFVAIDHDRGGGWVPSGSLARIE